MDKKAVMNSGRLKLPKNNRTDTNVIAKPKINLSCRALKGTIDNLKVIETKSCP